MIWEIETIEPAFVAAWTNAGQPDQAAIDAFLARTRRRQHAPAHDGVKRWYYLLVSNPRVRLGTIGRPLEDWAGLSCKILVGTAEIIGEFEGNRELVGLQGLQLKLQPAEWLKAPADHRFETGMEAIEEISEQILDLRSADRFNARTEQRYRWQK